MLPFHLPCMEWRAQLLFRWRQQGWGGSPLGSSTAEGGAGARPSPGAQGQRCQSPGRGVPAGHGRRFHPEGGQTVQDRAGWCWVTCSETSRDPRTQNTSVMQLSTALVHIPQHFPCEGEDFWRYQTDLSVADRTQGLQVFQGALSSSTVNRLDMIYLPELAFCRVCYYFIQLQWTKDMTLEMLAIPSDLHVRPTVRTRNNSEK